MIEFTENILYFLIYLYFNIWVFTTFKADALRYFSIILQFVTIFNVVSIFDTYTPILNHIVYDLLILISLWIICVGEIKNIRSQ